MRSHLLITFCLLILTSCSDHVGGYDKPEDLIQKEKMIEVMTELIKLETHIKETYVRVDRFYPVMTASGDSLLRTMGVSPESFDSSMKYYGSHQEQMQQIYSEVLEELSQELGELQDSE